MRLRMRLSTARAAAGLSSALERKTSRRSALGWAEKTVKTTEAKRRAWL